MENENENRKLSEQAEYAMAESHESSQDGYPDYKILLARITSPFIARGIRTKKDRHDRAKFGRNK